MLDKINENEHSQLHALENAFQFKSLQIIPINIAVEVLLTTMIDLLEQQCFLAPIQLFKLTRNAWFQ